MRDHMMRYHVNTSCRLAYLLLFDLMAGKGKFRSVVLSFAAEKAKWDREHGNDNHTGRFRRTEGTMGSHQRCPVKEIRP